MYTEQTIPCKYGLVAPAVNFLNLIALKWSVEMQKSVTIENILTFSSKHRPWTHCHCLGSWLKSLAKQWMSPSTEACTGSARRSGYASPHHRRKSTLLFLCWLGEVCGILETWQGCGGGAHRRGQRGWGTGGLGVRLGSHGCNNKQLQTLETYPFQFPFITLRDKH